MLSVWFCMFYVCQRELEEKQCHQIVGSLVDELVSGIKTPERPRSPIDSYLTEEEQFRRTNPQVTFTFISARLIDLI